VSTLAAVALALDWNGEDETEEERKEADRAISMLQHFPGAVLCTVQIPTGRHELNVRRKNLINIVNQVSRRAMEKGVICSFHPNSPHTSITRTEEDYAVILEGLDESATGWCPEERIYELRSYESSTEKLFKNKVDMFNKGEMNIFTDLKFNPVFFGEVLAGQNMPNLMYMTAFKDKASREAHWKGFTEHPDWEKMKSMKKYQNNVSRSNIYFLHPTPYSEI